MRTSEFYFYHGDPSHNAAAGGGYGAAAARGGAGTGGVGILPAVRAPRPQDRVTSSVRNHSWWVSTQLRPQVSGQPTGQSQFSQPSEVRHMLTPPRPFLTGQASTMEGLLSPRLYSRPAWSTHTRSRSEMYSPRNGWSTQDLHTLRHFSQHNLTSRLVPPPSGSIAGMNSPHSPPKHVHRYVEKLAEVWTPRVGTGRAASARAVHSDLDAFEARLAGRAMPPVSAADASA